MSDRTFLGLPIDGEPYISHRNEAPQLSEEEVTNLFRNVLSYNDVRAIGWTQYTPFFNDGEPCVFRSGDVYVSLRGVEVDENTLDLYDYGWMEDDTENNGRVWLSDYSEDFKTRIGDNSRDYSKPRDAQGNYQYKQNPDDAPNPELFRDWTALETAINSGACNSALMMLFGDHAQVIIDNEHGKVIIDEYEHD